MSFKSPFVVFFLGIAFVSVALGIQESIFNNFLSDTFGLSATERGGLEFPRELPGFLVVFMAIFLCALPITRVGVIGALGFAAGMAGIAFFGTRYGLMVFLMMVGSAGMHLLQPVGSSVAIALSDEHNRGRRLGQMGAVGTIGMILGTGAVRFGFDEAHPQYRIGFLCAAVAALLVAFCYLYLRMPDVHQKRSRLVIRKRYSLYYLLEFFFGARKQIFITFGPWVLIQAYGLPATHIAGLLMTASLIGIITKPLAGMAIDHFGERKVLIADGLVLSVVCLGYGYAGRMTDDVVLAQKIACVCYILDNLLFSLGAARAVYVTRLMPGHEELVSTLSMGVSMNHIASMVLPFAAGSLWMAMGYESVFASAAVLAIGIAALASFVPKKGAIRAARGTA